MAEKKQRAAARALLLLAGLLLAGPAWVGPSTAARRSPSVARGVFTLEDVPECAKLMGTSVEACLSAANQEQEAIGAELPVLNMLPEIQNLTPGWIFVSIIVPAFGVFLVSMFSTPITDKDLMGEEYEIDWSGKSGRLYKILNGEEVDSGYSQFPDGDNRVGDDEMPEAPLDAFTMLRDPSLDAKVADAEGMAAKDGPPQSGMSGSRPGGRL
jgi:hypothetical protein